MMIVRRAASLRELFKKWGHLATTIGLAITVLIFLFEQWDTGRRHDAEVDRRIAVNAEQIAELRLANIAQDEAHKTALAAMDKRIDIHRTELSIMRQEFITHYADDSRRFFIEGSRKR